VVSHAEYILFLKLCEMSFQMRLSIVTYISSVWEGGGAQPSPCPAPSSVKFLIKIAFLVCVRASPIQSFPWSSYKSAPDDCELSPVTCFVTLACILLESPTFVQLLCQTVSRCDQPLVGSIWSANDQWPAVYWAMHIVWVGYYFWLFGVCCSLGLACGTAEMIC
jgi:hypothetical protein